MDSGLFVIFMCLVGSSQPEQPLHVSLVDFRVFKRVAWSVTTGKESNRVNIAIHRGLCVSIFLGTVLGTSYGKVGQTVATLPEAEKFCTIHFDKDARRPARVEDSALSCLDEAAKRLKDHSDLKLVLVGIADLVKDYAADKNGKMRETEDKTGYDVRLEDLAAYRALNVKWYLTRWYGVDPSRILPTTDESLQGQDVTFFLVPGAADFNHNYLGTTKTNEKPCTVKPCYSPDEETLTAQPRSRIHRPVSN
jgi:hypothetical protein